MVSEIFPADTFHLSNLGNFKKPSLYKPKVTGGLAVFEATPIYPSIHSQ